MCGIIHVSNEDVPLMPTATSGLADFARLPIVEQNEVKSNLLSPSFIVGKDMDSFITDERFSDGRVCPHCGGKHIVRNGHLPMDLILEVQKALLVPVQ